MPPLVEPLEFLKEIHQAGVRYLLIGRQAIDDLIILKKLRSSPKDLEDIKYLRAVKAK